ncbi:SIS domain-containing protein [Rhizobium sp. YIM 134829]|uniref:SIS domain-containing protein n=1 Tax=Rhizobium sp. YIM 134829 TaxID=3390453 RepID=UPI00397CEE3C
MERLPFRDAVAQQPQSLQEALASLRKTLKTADLSALRTGTTAIIGIGASFYAGVVAAAQFRRQGLRAFAFAGGELYDAADNAADAYIAVSASGRSVEPAKAAGLRDKALTIGIAKTAESPLAAAVGTMIGTGSGIDSGPNTTSYLGSLLALGLIADAEGEPSNTNWDALPGDFEALSAAIADPVSKASALLAGKRSIDCVGANAQLGTAGYAALLLREAVRVPAQNWDTLNYLHGPMEPNDAGTGVIVFGDGRERQLAQDLAGFGIPTVLVTSAAVEDRDNLVVIRIPGTENGILAAIYAALPTQMIMQDLAEGVGLPKCEFRYRQTDTKLPLPDPA